MARHVSSSLLNIMQHLTKNSMNRNFHQSSIKNGKALVYQNYGDPASVLNLIEKPDQKPGDNEVAVKWMLSPVNPADINLLQGKYPARVKPPTIGGNEGVGEIIEVGNNVKNLSVGDRVVPNENNVGTWNTHGLHNADHVLKIPQNLDIIAASMFNVNPGTAYRMLKDFVDLKPGDVVIQNGANSAVGQFVIQLCKSWGYRSVNIVRDRPDIEKLRTYLTEMGATKVLVESELRTTKLFENKELPKPKLALNCVCGKTTTELIRHMDHGATMVTYGAMSREPLIVPASALIFKDVMMKGFWMTHWVKKFTDSQVRTDMIRDLTEMFNSKKLQVPANKIIPLSNYKEAMENTLKSDGMTNLKYILDLRC
ncbi:enoyl-[acyl-carrier-protein] reductase, mitochondrial-like [Chelonus insularis]|uniref:enoyl-[acyl-carrier-protein] reductase, mitochondrial-like n=1 Tax=Chelonus insularis TaxID=460826 RepID=UPI00158BA60B|nr:enoyl-[acyl-carrier-protein] reductase, mitochondrial-like [Chelonus insularis]